MSLKRTLLTAGLVGLLAFGSALAEGKIDKRVYNLVVQTKAKPDSSRVHKDSFFPASKSYFSTKDSHFLAYRDGWTSTETGFGAYNDTIDVNDSFELHVGSVEVRDTKLDGIVDSSQNIPGVNYGIQEEITELLATDGKLNLGKLEMLNQQWEREKTKIQAWYGQQLIDLSLN
jgi:hypothetical protein